MKIKVYLSIGCGNDHEDIIEIPDEEIEGKSEDEIEKVLCEHTKEWASNYIDIGWQRVD
ncbi:MAG: hypothetical protein M0021_09950 [Clostridia bacterium]|nr:hypothetical protein [Clostridia bacterium]